MQTSHSERRLLIRLLAWSGKPASLVVVLFLSFSLVSSAAIIRVPENYTEIQAAIDISSDGDEIIVSPDIYKENIHFLGKNIILRSTDPTSAAIVATTVIDGDQADSVVTFDGTENASCYLLGFTITNGYASHGIQGGGGGVCGNETLATIKYNNITGNATYDFLFWVGGGVYRCGGTIENNTISLNFAPEGGGLWGCDGTIQNNIITTNTAGAGGGVSQCHGTIQNNFIAGNTVKGHGGGILGSNGTIQDNIVVHNVAEGGGAGGIGGCNGLIQNNIVSENSTLSFGGGLLDCDGTVQNNVITSNTAESGGGFSNCDGIIRGNTIAYNQAIGGTEFPGAGGGLAYCYDAMLIENNTIIANSAWDGGGLNDCGGTIRYNTISYNRANDDGGGLVGCHAITIDHNAITHNSANGEGGGLNSCGEIIENNIVSHNSALKGGGLSYCFYTIQNNIVNANVAVYAGGMSWCINTIRNNTVVGNVAQYGGGMFDCRADIINCIIANNENCGIYETYHQAEPNEIKYCNIYGNTSGDYYDDDTNTTYTGTEINSLIQVHDCISVDPLLVDPDHGDFHLQPMSPCIDAGCNIPSMTEDFEGDPRRFDAIQWESRGDGSHFDIGADEFYITPVAVSPRIWLLYSE